MRFLPTPGCFPQSGRIRDTSVDQEAAAELDAVAAVVTKPLREWQLLESLGCGLRPQTKGSPAVQPQRLPFCHPPQPGFSAAQTLFRSLRRHSIIGGR
jgi:hypothetical protein